MNYDDTLSAIAADIDSPVFRTLQNSIDFYLVQPDATLSLDSAAKLAQRFARRIIETVTATPSPRDILDFFDDIINEYCPTRLTTTDVMMIQDYVIAHFGYSMADLETVSRFDEDF